MTLWGAKIKPGVSSIFDCEEGSLDLTHATLISGTSALLYLNISKRRFIVGRLTAEAPNLKTQLLLEEDTEFVVEGANAEVSVIGNLRLHSASHDEDDFCCAGLDEEEDEYVDDRKLLDVSSDDEDEGDDEPNRIVEVTDEEANLIIAQRKEAISVPTAVALKPSLGSQLMTDKKRKADTDSAPTAKKIKTLDAEAEATVASKKQPAPIKKDAASPKKEQVSQAKNEKTPSPSKKEASSTPAKKELPSVAPGVLREVAGGVKFEVLSVGKGKIASIGKRVKVKYEGRLSRTGKKFDAGTLDFTIGGGDMIQGFDLGVRGMLMQEKRRVFIPSRLAYGKQKVGGIPPNSDLIFEITLLSTS